MIKKYYKGAVITVIGICLICFFIFGVGKNRNSTNERQTTASKEKESTWDKIRKAGYDARIVEAGKENIQDGYRYQIHSAQLLKKQGDWKKPDSSWYQIDQDGNVLGDDTLVKVNITIQREKKAENDDEIYLNMMYLYLYDKDGNPVNDQNDNGYEPCAASVVTSDDQDAFRYPLKEGESVTTDLIYAVPDQSIKRTEHYLLHVNLRGADPSCMTPEEHSYMEIEMENKTK